MPYKDKTKANKGATKWQKANPEKMKIIQRRYRIKNREKRMIAQKAQGVRYRLEAIAHYSKGENVCACCNENIVRFLTIDHIEINGAEHRRQYKINHIARWLKKMKYPKGFQVLCFNCNLGRAHNKGICPHKK